MIKQKLIRFFGLSGSWKWACRKMRAGHVVKILSNVGTRRLKLDNEGQERIMEGHAFRDDPERKIKWYDAKVFISDFETTDWAIAKLKRNA